ncbi:MAG: ABC transporter permease subunit [Sorangiineae bacterium]|nr:ABC transporter permease subunit [Polyangiaceae bacterium]MEB2321609.1 ABC transporter permease subunit [Sorangiineae bacterium]
MIAALARLGVLTLALLALLTLFVGALGWSDVRSTERVEHLVRDPASGPSAIRVDGWPGGPARNAARSPAGNAMASHEALRETLRGLPGALGTSAAVLALSLLLGVPLGVVSGYLSPLADALLARLVEFLGAWPTLVVVGVAWMAQDRPDAFSLIAALAVTRAVRIARLTRGEVLRVGGEEFVLAARALGASPREVLVRHVLPHALTPALTAAAFSAAAVVGLEAALGYLGVDLPAPLPSWGALLAAGGGPGVVVWPALAALLTTGSVYLVALGLDDALARRQRLRRAPSGL